MNSLKTLVLTCTLVGVSTATVFGQTAAKTPAVSPTKETTSIQSKPTELKAVASTARRPGEMTLTDTSGRKLDVEVLGANGDTLRIRRMTDEREFEIQMTQLDSLSSIRVQKWIDRTPAMTKFSIQFEVEKRLAESDDFSTAGRTLKTSQWVYDVKLTNLTRNVLNDAIVEYRIVYDDAVAFSRTSAMPGKGAKQQEGQEVALPEMGFNERAEFTTPKLKLETYEYAPSRGEKEYERDKLIGIWIRVTKRGQILDEFKSNLAAMQAISWDSEDDEEIIITDSFKDKFNPISED